METHPYPFQNISLLLVITTTICLFHVRNSSAVDDDRYLNCSTSFQCANFRDVPYPFWGSSRPDYCGFPDFKLNCSGDVPVISFEGQDYRVLDINQSTSTLRVARTDFWNNLCPVSLANTTIKSSHIENTSDAQEVLLFYDCPPIFIPLPNLPTGQFNCTVNSKATSINYFVTNLELPNISGYCNTTVTARVSQSAAADLGLNSSKDNLVAALDSGFGLKWDASNTLCGQCQVSRGQCGYNISSTEFTCFCKDGPNPSRCEASEKHSKTVCNPLPPHYSPTFQSTSAARHVITKPPSLLHISSLNSDHFPLRPPPTPRRCRFTPTYPPMLPLLFFFFFFFLFFLLCSVDVATSFPAHADLSNCTQTFDCGPLRNLTYPFTGGTRPSYCGPPEFHLTCVDDSPELTIGLLSYRILKLDPAHQNMTVARSDLWNSSCTDKLANSTLESGFFSYNEDDDMDVTIFYGCNSTFIDPKPPNWFLCDLNFSFKDAYYLIGPVPLDPIVSQFKCSIGITVPILKTTAAVLVGNRSLFKEAIMAGFNVNYTNPYEKQCAECLNVNGLCGFDSDKNRPVCICGKRLCDPAGKKTGIAIGLAIGGAILFGILVGFYVYYFIQRKKRKLAAETQSKEQPTPLTSNSITTPLTNLSQSQSIPSYPSFTSKSEYDNKASTYFGVKVFSYTELEEATENFNPAKELGDGGFGTVYYGKLHDGRVVAVKRLYENNFKRVEQFMNEVEILTRLEHRNLVKLYGCTSKRSRELLLVYEYIPNGTVADHLHGKRVESGFLSWPVRLNIAIETADALAYLHRNDVIHRDVKSNNILLEDDFCVKVADFGLSRLFPNDATHVSTAPQGTPGYVDPEYYQCYQLTDKSDVYSFGVVLIELLSSLQAVDTNRHRLDINLANLAVNKIQNHLVNELVDPLLGFETNVSVRRMTTAVAELAFRCLQQEKDMRPTMDEVLKGLKAVQNEDLGSENGEAVVLDIGADEVGLLKSMPPPLSPDSNGTDKLVSSSTTPSSF